MSKQTKAASVSGMNGFSALATAQMKAFFRDKATLFWMLAFPLLFLVIFGLMNSGDDGASKSKVTQIGSVQLIDKMPAQAKKQYDDLFETTKSDDRAAALEELRKGDTDAVIEQQGNTLKVHYSNADQVKASTVQGTLRSFVDGANMAAAKQKPTFTLSASPVEDESLKPIQFLAPGLLGYALAMGGVFGGAMTLVNWRKTLLLRRMRMTPTGTGAIVSSRVLVSLLVAVLQFILFVGAGVVFFGLQLTGSWWAAFPLALIGMLPFLAIGLMAGSVSKSEEAASGLANLIVLPMSFLGGAFIPLQFAPGWMQTVADFLPMSHLTQGMTDVMVRGEGPGAIGMPALILLGFTVLFTALAAKMFRWEKG